MDTAEKVLEFMAVKVGGPVGVERGLRGSGYSRMDLGGFDWVG